MIRRRLKHWLPSEQRLHGARSLRWLGPLLRRHWLWHLTRRRVAAGAAIGVFFGFLVPVMQIAAAAVAAVVLRANLPVAAAATLVSNPLTYVPIWVAAHRTGTLLLGAPIDPAKARAQAEALAQHIEAGGGAADDAPGWSRRLLDIGKPLMLGLLVFALLGAALAWLAVHLLWAGAVALRRRRRRRARRRRASAG